MNKVCWTVVATLAVGASAANAQLPTRKVKPMPEIVVPKIATASKLTRTQILSRLPLVKSNSTVANPPGTPPAGSTSGPAPTVVERETLSAAMMESGASRLTFNDISMGGYANGRIHVGISEGSQWRVIFRGSGNAYAVDCKLYTGNADVSYVVRLVDGPGAFREIEGTAPLFDNHVVMTVPRATVGKEIWVTFQSPVRPNGLVSAFESCQILELS